MCGRCEGEPYRGVKALFNGDLQQKMAFQDREDWLVVSNRVTVFLGESALRDEANPLFRGCEVAESALTDDEQTQLNDLSRKLARPAIGRP